jgi:hypothetical protein
LKKGQDLKLCSVVLYKMIWIFHCPSLVPWLKQNFWVNHFFWSKGWTQYFFLVTSFSLLIQLINNVLFDDMFILKQCISPEWITWSVQSRYCVVSHNIALPSVLCESSLKLWSNQIIVTQYSALGLWEHN